MYINSETHETAQSKREVVRKIKAQNPGLLITNNPPDELLANYGWEPVQTTERPVGDVVTQGKPEQRDGVWYQTWEARDYTAEELEQQRQASIPVSVTPRQARLALLSAGLLDQVEPALASLDSPDRESAQIEWEYATEVERQSAWVSHLGEALGLSETGIDDLFIEAVKL